MLNLNLVRVLSVLLGAFALFAFTSSASASELGTVRSSVDQRLNDATSVVTGSSNPAPAGATTSRKRSRLMPSFKARNNARTVARYVYLDPDLGLTEYGVRTCRRVSRPRVDCYTWVAGPVYDDDGYYLDTILCDWYTASAYLRSGKMKVWSYASDCVALSEV